MCSIVRGNKKDTHVVIKLDTFVQKAIHLGHKGGIMVFTAFAILHRPTQEFIKLLWDQVCTSDFTSII